MRLESLGLFFFSFEHAKNLLIVGPNNTKNCSLKWIILSESCFYCKKTPNLIKKLFLCYVSKPGVGPINSQHNNFKWGNIFAGICTLVLSLCIIDILASKLECLSIFCLLYKCQCCQTFFSSSLVEGPNKLECLPLESFFYRIKAWLFIVKWCFWF
jgi:hypothetical protein